ncbi:unnamed protein product [Rhodiola kirilowii]
MASIPRRGSCFIGEDDDDYLPGPGAIRNEYPRLNRSSMYHYRPDYEPEEHLFFRIRFLAEDCEDVRLQIRQLPASFPRVVPPLQEINRWRSGHLHVQRRYAVLQRGMSSRADRYG